MMMERQLSLLLDVLHRFDEAWEGQTFGLLQVRPLLHLVFKGLHSHFGVGLMTPAQTGWTLTCLFRNKDDEGSLATTLDHCAHSWNSIDQRPLDPRRWRLR